jgi:hypothetical protein
MCDILNTISVLHFAVIILLTYKTAFFIVRICNNNILSKKSVDE